jgi:hypothetical protein
LAFGLLAGHRGFVAAVSLLSTVLWLVTGFIGGALYDPPVSGPGTSWILEHSWYLNVGSWVTFAAWSLAILLRPTREVAIEEPPQAAIAASS